VVSIPNTISDPTLETMVPLPVPLASQLGPSAANRSGLGGGIGYADRSPSRRTWSGLRTSSLQRTTIRVRCHTHTPAPGRVERRGTISFIALTPSSGFTECRDKSAHSPVEAVGLAALLQDFQRNRGRRHRSFGDCKPKDHQERAGLVKSAASAPNSVPVCCPAAPAFMRQSGRASPSKAARRHPAK
jgi:hypothetical protein